MNNIHPIWWVLIGAVSAFVLLKIISKTDLVTSNTSARFKALAFTMQASNLMKTNEFREIVKTKEFRDFIASLAEDQVVYMSQALVGNTKTF